MTDTRDNTEGEALFTVEEGQNERIDAFIARNMPDHVSRSRIKDIVKQGGVTLNGHKCVVPNQRLKTGDMVSLDIPEPEDPEPKPENIPLDIYYEDDHLLVVNKPAGLVVHPAAGNWNGTLVNALLHHCGKSLQGIGGVRRPGIVHRLDKETSGLLVVAKTEQAHAGLTAQFMDHGRSGPLKRAYLALVWGRLDTMIGRIETHLARSSTNRRKRAVVSPKHSEGKNAITHYTVRNEYGEDEHPQVSLVECRLETGRTHQIRVHMSHIGHPLVGDQEYGKHFQTKINALPESVQQKVGKFRRQALHAAILGFEHPVTNDYLEFEAPLPDDFTALMCAFEHMSNPI